MPLWPIGLRGKGLNKLRATFEGIYILIFLILDSAFEYMIVLSCAYNSYLLTYCRFNSTIKGSITEVNYFGMVMNIACMECSNLSRWDLFYRTLCMFYDTQRKGEHSVTL